MSGYPGRPAVRRGRVANGGRKEDPGGLGAFPGLDVQKNRFLTHKNFQSVFGFISKKR